MPRVRNIRNTGFDPTAQLYVGRANPKLKLKDCGLSNPYKVKPHGKYTRDEAIAQYIATSILWAGKGPRHLEANPWALQEIRDARNKDLFCWCAPENCHADWLLILANPEKHWLAIDFAEEYAESYTTPEWKYMSEAYIYDVVMNPEPLLEALATPHDLNLKGGKVVDAVGLPTTVSPAELVSCQYCGRGFNKRGLQYHHCKGNRPPNQ